MAASNRVYRLALRWIVTELDSIYRAHRRLVAEANRYQPPTSQD